MPLRSLWRRVQSSLWFVPSLLIVLAVALAMGMVELDSWLSISLGEKLPRFFDIGPEGSRDILSVIASATITVAGVTFSITIVALSLAANQYTPRVLRNFMRDRGTQLVLGGLVSVFVYCLIVLRTIRDGDDAFVPGISVVLGIVLAVAGIGLFIFFIHHVASSIQVTIILEALGDETEAAIEHLFPEDVGDTQQEEERGSDEEWRGVSARSWVPVMAEASGYLQAVEPDSLLRFAEAHDTVVRMERRVGDFVVKGTPLVWVAGQEEPARRAERALRRAFDVQPYRSIEQDAAFGIQQIVDIGLKALSTGMNDPTTAQNALDRLESILRATVRRRIPSPFRYVGGELRVIAKGIGFEPLVDSMFHELRQSARDNVSVYLRMLSAIERVGSAVTMGSRRRCLLKHVRLIARAADANIEEAHDRRVIREGTVRTFATFAGPRK